MHIYLHISRNIVHSTNYYSCNSWTLHFHIESFIHCRWIRHISLPKNSQTKHGSTKNSQPVIGALMIQFRLFMICFCPRSGSLLHVYGRGSGRVWPITWLSGRNVIPSILIAIRHRVSISDGAWQITKSVGLEQNSRYASLLEDW